MVSSLPYNFFKSLMLDLLNDISNGDIIFFCKDRAKHSKYPHIHLVPNTLQFRIQRNFITTGNRLPPSICKIDRYHFAENSKIIVKKAIVDSVPEIGKILSGIFISHKKMTIKGRS